MNKGKFLRLMGLFSAGLVLAAFALSRVLLGEYFPFPIMLSWRAAGLTMAGAGLLMAIIYLLVRVDGFIMPRILARLRQLKPLLLDLNQSEIIFISVLAGFSEELFFRGLLQPLVGMTAASLVFGALHAVTLGYFLLASAMGFYLGGLYEGTGNLLVPMTVHALYDIFALNLLIRIYRREELEAESSQPD